MSNASDEDASSSDEDEDEKSHEDYDIGASASGSQAVMPQLSRSVSRLRHEDSKSYVSSAASVRTTDEMGLSFGYERPGGLGQVGVRTEAGTSTGLESFGTDPGVLQLDPFGASVQRAPSLCRTTAESSMQARDAQSSTRRILRGCTSILAGIQEVLARCIDVAAKWRTEGSNGPRTSPAEQCNRIQAAAAIHGVVLDGVQTLAAGKPVDIMPMSQVAKETATEATRTVQKNPMLIAEFVPFLTWDRISARGTRSDSDSIRVPSKLKSKPEPK